VIATTPPRAPLWRSWLALAAVATVCAAGAVGLHPAARALLSAGGLPDEISAAEARASRRELIWIDARPAGDFSRGHVPEALPLTEERWDEQIEAVVLRWRPGVRVVVYCSSTGCQASRRVADLLRTQYQFDDVWVLRGGWEAWEKVESP
jgi:rhodanese-related sulfurtransferase